MGDNLKGRFLFFFFLNMGKKYVKIQNRLSTNTNMQEGLCNWGKVQKIFKNVRETTIFLLFQKYL